MNAQDRADQNFGTIGEDPVEDFHIVSQVSVMNETEAMVSIPLPMDLPPVPNLSSLPAHVLHSGTVETLIGQNEDLMARLKVNIRRNSVLEQQIMEQDRLHARLKSDHASLIAQYQVMQEKSELLREKSTGFTAMEESLREQIEISQIRAETAEERSAELRAGLAFEKAYRRRVGAWVRPYIERMKEHLVDARGRVAFLDRQLGSREAVIGDLRERLSSAERAAQTVVVKSNADQANLIESYEERVTTAERDAIKARNEVILLTEKASRVEAAVAASAAAENKVIALERRNSDMERALNEEMAQIQEQLAAFRREAKELAAETMAARAERDEAVTAASAAREEQARAADQFETLQSVWSEAQKKFEASRLQQESLNKLNQELSRQLKTERKARETAAPVVAATSVEAAGPRLERIDTLLAQLESGYAKARGLDFIEDEPAMEAVVESPREASP